MDLDFLPQKFAAPLLAAGTDKLYEMRLRAGFAVTLIYGGKRVYLSPAGVTLFKNDGIIAEAGDLAEIIDNVTERSIYAFNERIKQGFITAAGGIRIGIAGECVYDKDGIVTIKNFTSLNVRVPHEVKGCSDGIYKKIVDKEVKSTLIISPPSYGKTTLLKDLAKKLDDLNIPILLIDERGEFCDVSGENIDAVRYSDKLYAFEYGIRSLSPSVVITDELCDANDWKCARKAADCGVKIIASVHGKTLSGVVGKECFAEGVFERYALITRERGAGNSEIVYDGRYNEI